MLRELSIAICTIGSVEHKDGRIELHPGHIFSPHGNVSLPLTVFREGELEHRRNEEGQRAFGVVDFSAALTQPAGLSLVRYLIEASIFSCHEDTSQVCGGDGEDVGVVCGDGEEGVWQQLHSTRHAVIQPCDKTETQRWARQIDTISSWVLTLFQLNLKVLFISHSETLKLFMPGALQGFL